MMSEIRRSRYEIPALLVLFSIGAFFLSAPILQAQAPVYKPGEYPAPRYPKLPKNPTVDDLMPTARKIVRLPMVPKNKLLVPSFGVKPGERILLAVAKDHSPLVIEALRRAIQEVGAKVDVLIGNDFTSGGDDVGVKEFLFHRYEDDMDKAWTGGISFETLVDMAVAGKYDMGASGETVNVDLPPALHGKLRWAPLPWAFTDQFLLSDSTLPADLLKLIDDTTWAELQDVVSIRATDPEGTDISWVTDPAYFVGKQLMGHLNIRGEYRFLGKVKPGGPGANGVLVGTWNHTGPFPTIRVTFKDDRVQSIEGGGPYGEGWRNWIEEFKDVTWPSKQGPGLFNYLFEAALGTNPRIVRPKDATRRPTGNWTERLRSGIVHWGIGAGSTDAKSGQSPHSGGGETEKYYEEHPDTPSGHIHIHNYFLTVTVTYRDGRKKDLIRKGHLTVLDEPEIRRAASQYGDPDELLRELWIPAVPGINIPGEYQKDYGNNPGAYFRENMSEY